CTGWRLPTEAEWEYAARGGEAFAYAGSPTVSDVVHDPGTLEGASCQALPNAYGLCDMSGNYREWTLDGANVVIVNNAAAAAPYPLQTCGNGVRDNGEVCDGTDVPACAGAGTIACNPDCSLDLSTCPASFCGAGGPTTEAGCTGPALTSGALADPVAPSALFQGFPIRITRSAYNDATSDTAFRNASRTAAFEFGSADPSSTFGGGAIRLVLRD
ncbi:MAG: SUMF1/EgtB/PvdO family nonheme iron enzyme, partial [Myxococcales bacterium]|nr:SUMF1/EgtB/PvdO family nonheme iron enzyme [Myxococcales bacterium]